MGLVSAAGLGGPAGASELYTPDWGSLEKNPAPEWLLNAKFGIYAHWGVYSVPAFGHEWYAKHMYDPGNTRGVYEHHRKVYGTQDKFGYKDLVPMFKAEKFDPREWAGIVRQSGAKYAGIAVVHHDGFLLWDSKVSRWNSARMGPRRDLFGELVKAYRAAGLKIVATEHHMRTFDWYLPADAARLEEIRRQNFDLFDPKYADLYWNRFTGNKQEFLKAWKAKLLEVIDKYQPDVLWFDGGDFTSPEVAAYVKTTLARYFNEAREGTRDVAVLNKLAGSGKYNFPHGFGMLTFEGGRDRPAEVARPWIDDLSIGIGSWGYVEGLKLRTARELILGLVDRVSRGGGLLLSLSPMANGEIPAGQQALLREMGEWLKVNGEAIHGTRTWKVHAEGSTEKLMVTQGKHSGWNFDRCSAEDIRFTRKGALLYAIALGWPESGAWTIKSLGSEMKAASVTMLGSSATLKWSQGAGGLTIQAPGTAPSKHAYTFRIASK